MFLGYSYNKWHRIHPDVEVMYRDQGHILGSASVTLRINENGKETFWCDKRHPYTCSYFERY